MSHPRRNYDPEFKVGAVRIVQETRRPIAEVARELGIGAGILGNWVRKDRIERVDAEGLSSDDRAELVRLRTRCAELRVPDVLERVGVSRRTLCRWRADGTFPQALKLSANSIGWGLGGRPAKWWALGLSLGGWLPAVSSAVVRLSRSG